MCVSERGGEGTAEQQLSSGAEDKMRGGKRNHTLFFFPTTQA